MRSALLYPLLAALAAAGCGERDPSCQEAVGAFAAMAERAVAAEPDEVREEALAGLPALSERLREDCDRNRWDPALRRCIVRSQSPHELERCHPAPPPEAPEVPDP